MNSANRKFTNWYIKILNRLLEKCMLYLLNNDMNVDPFFFIKGK